MRLELGTINIPRRVGVRSWRRCFALTANRAEIFGMQEIFTKAQKQLILAEVRKRPHLSQYGTLIGPNPIAWDRTVYTRISGRQIRLHAAATGTLARQYPGFNAPRFVNEVILRRADGQGPDVAVLNAHLVPGGKKVDAKWRRQVRKASKEQLRALVRQHHAAGRIVALVGDLNVRLPFIVVAGWRWLRGTGIDKAGVLLPAGWVITSVYCETFAAPTDHKKGVRAGATYRRKTA